MTATTALADRMVGRTMTLQPPEPDWTFVTADGGAAITAGYWRLCGPSGVMLTSEDHGHRFGLPAPVDGVTEFAERAGNAAVISVVGDERTGDLRIMLDGDMVVELLCTSSGYECWQANAGPVALVGRGDGIIDIGLVE